MIGRVLSLAVACIWICAACALADDWNSFRGPDGSGVVQHASLPMSWAGDQHVVWKTELPGMGWSQPVICGEKVFVTTAAADGQAKPNANDWGPGAGAPSLLSFFSGNRAGGEPPDVECRWQLFCFDAATGEVIWERGVHRGRPTIPIHANNTYATETPATDGQCVVAYFGMLGIWCYDLAGSLLWQQDLEAYPTQYDWGTGSSPVIFDDLVYIQCDNQQASYIAALDKQSGNEVWRRDREEKTNWSTPFVWKNKLRTELVTAGGGRIRSYDPKTGDVLWEMQGSGRTATTPVGDEQLLLVDSYDRLMGRIGAFAAIRPGASGDISLTGNESSSEFVAWSTQLSGNRVASPLLYRNCVYVAEQRSGIVRCLDATTGREHYRKRLPGAAGFTASPLACNGNVFLLDQNGRTTVIEAGPELKVVSTSDLKEMCWASPAVVGDHLLLRTLDHLYCIGE